MSRLLQWLPLALSVPALFGSTWTAVVYRNGIATTLLVLGLLALFIGATINATRPAGFRVYGAASLPVVLFLCFGALLGAGGTYTGLAMATAVALLWAGSAVVLAWSHALRAILWAAADPGRARLDLNGSERLRLADALIGRLGVLGFLELVRLYDDAVGNKGAERIVYALPTGVPPREAAAAFVLGAMGRDGGPEAVWNCFLMMDPDAIVLRPRVIELTPQPVAVAPSEGAGAG
jgi:hypothetical protein